jgi:FKBP-type peptidyl-prolyl cis-trans isomerase
MKNLFFLSFIFLALGAQAQKTVPKKTTAAKSSVKPASNPALKNLTDSVSYAIGLSVAKFYSQQGIKNLNGDLVSKAIGDIFGKRKELLTEEQSQEVVMRFLNPGLYKNIEAGEKFLASNKKKPGIRITASGIQYEVMREGTGVKPKETDTVEVNYAGTLVNGTEFDNSYKRGQPISFPLNGVIRGWTEALQLMPAGSKYKLYIPYQLGYGMNDNGPIPGGSLLIFEVELLSVKAKNNQ